MLRFCAHANHLTLAKRSLFSANAPRALCIRSFAFAFAHRFEKIECARVFTATLSCLRCATVLDMAIWAYCFALLNRTYRMNSYPGAPQNALLSTNHLLCLLLYAAVEEFVGAGNHESSSNEFLCAFLQPNNDAKERNKVVYANRNIRTFSLLGQSTTAGQPCVEANKGGNFLFDCVTERFQFRVV